MAASSEGLGRVASASTISFSGGWITWKGQLKINPKPPITLPWNLLFWSAHDSNADGAGQAEWEKCGDPIDGFGMLFPHEKRYKNWEPIIKQRKVSRDVAILDGACRARGYMGCLSRQLPIASFVTRKRKKFVWDLIIELFEGDDFVLTIFWWKSRIFNEEWMLKSPWGL